VMAIHSIKQRFDSIQRLTNSIRFTLMRWINNNNPKASLMSRPLGVRGSHSRPTSDSDDDDCH
jgi:hypothetical protein